MKCVKVYKKRKLADIDASKLLSNSIPCVVYGHELTPKIVSIDSGDNVIELCVEEKFFTRAEMIINNTDPAIVKIFKILTYKNHHKQIAINNKKIKKLEKLEKLEQNESKE